MNDEAAADAPITAGEISSAVADIFLFDGKGGFARLEGKSVSSLPSVKGFTLIVGSLASPEFGLWLKHEIGPLDGASIVTQGSSARCQILDDKAIVVLRVARPSAEPDDIGRQFMGIWMERGRLVIATDVHVVDMMSLTSAAKSGNAPHSPAEFVARLGLRTADRFEPLVEKMADSLDRIEEGMLSGTARDHRQHLAKLRRNLITFRRFLWPQRDVLNTLEIEDLSFLSKRDRLRLREASARTARLGDELQALSERAALVHEQILDKRSEQTNRAMLVLAIVTTTFMPLMLITGILGMNISGIPFSDNPMAFSAVLAVLLVLAVIQFAWFRLRHWV